MKFNELPIDKRLVKATETLGFIDATEIQANVIPHAVEREDIIAQAPTGTGKTCAYGLPILNTIDLKLDSTQALILAPTRELAMQITNDLLDYSMYLEGLRIVCLYGGESIDKQIVALKKKPQIVVATPGRLKDHIGRKTVKINNIRALVLDEADEMLNMGFREDVDEILESVKNDEHQTMLFSATFPKEIEAICENYLHNAYHVKLQTKSLTVETVKQFYIMVKEKDKIEVMSRIIDLNGYKSVMIFCNTKKAVDEVSAGLLQRGYMVEGLHGDMRQLQRDRVMERFRNNKLDILVASDVAARGLDVDDVDAVINYDVPDDDEYYIHRIGRTGRAKKEGLAITLVNTNERFRLRGIIAYTKATIERMDVPDLKQVLKVRIQRIISNAIASTMSDDVNTMKNKKMIQKVIMQEIVEKSILAEDIISGLILMQMEENQEIDEIYEGVESKSKTKNANVNRLFINLGKSHGLRSAELKEIISRMANIKIDNILNMEVHDDFSFFELPKDLVEKVLNAFVREKYQNKRIIIEIAKEKSKSNNRGKTHGKKNDSYKGGSKSSSNKKDGNKKSSGGKNYNRKGNYQSNGSNKNKRQGKNK